MRPGEGLDAISVGGTNTTLANISAAKVAMGHQTAMIDYSLLGHTWHEKQLNEKSSHGRDSVYKLRIIRQHENHRWTRAQALAGHRLADSIQTIALQEVGEVILGHCTVSR